ncbi:MAG: amidohydrolase [Actinomycetota bacterium]|nr:amidohydrolase [Actinomycetota bacterium]
MARRSADGEPGLPIKLGPCSNGEYEPPPPTPLVREAVRRAQVACDDNARWTGLSRRDFLRSACAAATTLTVLAACSKDSNDGRRGGTFELPPESTVEPEAAADALGGDELIFDVQGHLLEFDLDEPLPARYLGSNFPQADCGDDDPRTCFSTGHFLEEVFLRSDTSMAVLSAVPVGSGPGGPLSAEVMAAALRQADGLCGEGRLLMQGHATPSAGPFEETAAAMAEVADRYRIAAWKVYTHAGGPGWYLDDHDPSAPQVGGAFVRRAVELGIPVIAVHKGLSGGSPYAAPLDVGPAARDHPDARFVVYHSGYETSGDEGPYTEATRDVGVNRLITSLLDAGIGPGGNVYAELGSTWRSVMGAPEDAAHVLGKLLVHLGEDNVVWGTDSIWYGSPQDQIQAFRAFQISEELQERHGYPALTPERKAKILGLSSARLYGVDPVRQRCAPTPAERDALRAALPGTAAVRGFRTAAAVRAYQLRSGWF